MCGIYGKINFNQNSEDTLEELRLMMAESEYRGPDSQQCVEYDGVQFGFNRLAIIDLDARSNQPFENKELGLSVVFNGEIYNYVEIRSELEQLGYVFATCSDTEVLITAYHHFREEAFSKFNGMWALAIYDSKKNRVILARDRFGVKPLYYMVQNGIFYFASEMKSLLKVKAVKELNPAMMDNFLINGLNNSSFGDTFVTGIFEFPAGSVAEVVEAKLEIQRYYEAPRALVEMDETAIVEQLNAYFKSAVKLRMRADVPVALLLSAGLDSSAMAFAIDAMVENKEIEVQSVHAFTLNFVGFDKNEWELVQENAKQLKHVICHPIDIEIEAFKKAIPSLIAEFDIPVLSVSHLLHRFALCEIKKRGFTVVLNGQGSDEIWGGYIPSDLGSLLIDHFIDSWKKGCKELKMVKSNWNYSYFFQLKYLAKSIIERKAQRLFWFFKTLFVLKNVKCKLNDLSQCNLDYYSFFDYASKKRVFGMKFNGILQYEDMASMLNSMEMRSPFLDYRLVNLGLSLPSNFKLHDGHSKWILRKAFSSFLPENICWAGWKLGYAVPKKILLEELLPNTEDTESGWNNAWRQYNLKCWLEARGIK